MFHIDFSENYGCKHHKEIQACHFGASHSQVTLHTGIAYTRNGQPHSFCSVTDGNRHDASAILVHIEAALTYFREIFPAVKHVYFISDGPTTQYRSKYMFYLISTKLFQWGYSSISWNFLEASHGKGAADGVGGVLKRTAERMVAQGKSILNAQDFVNLMENAVSAVKLLYIPEADFGKFDADLPNSLATVPGTMKIHQVGLN